MSFVFLHDRTKDFFFKLNSTTSGHLLPDKREIEKRSNDRYSAYKRDNNR